VFPEAVIFRFGFRFRRFNQSPGLFLKNENEIILIAVVSKVFDYRLLRLVLVIKNQNPKTNILKPGVVNGKN
jgi:hypothetical protein